MGKISHPKITEPIYICTIYRPPDTNKHLFLKELKKLLCSQSQTSDMVVIGDMNIDLKLSTTICQSYTNLMHELGLTQGTSSYTRIAKLKDSVTKSCIDHIFARSNRRDLHSAVVNTVIADHCLTGISMVGNEVTRGDSKIIKTFNMKKLHEKLDLVNWDYTSSMSNPNKILEYIVNNFYKCYETTKINIPQKDLRPPWYHGMAQKYTQLRDEAFTAWRKSPTNAVLRLEYNRLRNKTNKEINKNKNAFIKSEIENCKGDIKKLWNIINKLTGKTSNNIEDTIYKYITDIPINTVVNKFADEFKNAVAAIKTHCNKKILDPNTYLKATDKSMRLKMATDEDIKRLIHKLDDNKSPGADKIRAKDVKYACTAIAPAIKNLINSSIRTGQYPDFLKLGIIRPIYKKGDHTTYSNYRPITILSCIDKIFEKFLGDQIQNYLQKNSIISSKQYGFQRNKSTSQLLANFADEIYNHLDKKKHILIVFIDYSKAFDTLSHTTINVKNDLCGIRGPLQRLLQNYHKNRKSLVKIDNVDSTQFLITEGTAQGSVIGPIEYLIYVNDMPSVAQKCSMYQFADDTAIIAAHNDLTEAQKMLQDDFNSICKWSHDAGLVLNTDKTKLLHVRSSHIKSPHSPTITAHTHDCMHSRCSSCCCPSLELVRHIKYVGLIVDDRFSWSKHIDSICAKLRALLSKFKILKHRLPTHILLILYKTMVESIVTYGLSTYGRASPYLTNEIHKLQERILKSIVPLAIKLECRSNPLKLFSYCKTMPLPTLFDYYILKGYNKLQNKLSLTKICHKITTRKTTQNKYYIPKFNNKNGQRTASYLIPTKLNELPCEIRLYYQEHNLKRKLKKYYTLTH